MATEITVSPSYSCPHCQALIRAGEDVWQGWLCCPRCSRPGLPPPRLRVFKANPHPVAPTPPLEQDMSKMIDGLLDEPIAQARPAPSTFVPKPVTTAPRLIITTGLFVSAFLVLNAFLDRSAQGMLLFGLLAVVFLISLLRMRISPRRD